MPGKHWHYVDLGQGVHAYSPELAQYLEDEFVLGARVAEAFEDELFWGAMGVILLELDAPRDPA